MISRSFTVLNTWFYAVTLFIDIKPRMKQLHTLMHHKFVIIDKTLLITGSINWTMAAFFGNFENILVTNECTAVTSFLNEFEKIWTMLDTVNSTKHDFEMET